MSRSTFNVRSSVEGYLLTVRAFLTSVKELRLFRSVCFDCWLPACSSVIQFALFRLTLSYLTASSQWSAPSCCFVMRMFRYASLWPPSFILVCTWRISFPLRVCRALLSAFSVGLHFVTPDVAFGVSLSCSVLQLSSLTP